jgi:hypothetical protein
MDPYPEHFHECHIIGCSNRSNLICTMYVYTDINICIHVCAKNSWLYAYAICIHGYMAIAINSLNLDVSVN